MTRVLLIDAVRKANKFSYAPFPALNLGYIASYLRKYNEISEICIIERSYEYNIENIVKKFRPDIVGISSTTQEYNAAIMISNQIKELDSGIIVIMGGHHITASPNSLTRNMDIGVMGEGEETFSEIVKSYENKDLFASLDKISGIIYWRDGSIISTKRRELISPLDNIPFPARDLLYIEKNTHIITSRGCPYRCIYCSSASFWGSHRFHSPNYTLKEIKELIYKFDVKYIHIEDDLFIANKKRVEQIAKLIREEHIHKDITFECSCRANLLNEEIIKILKSMNIKNICIGFETGSDTILQKIKVGSVTVQQNKDAIKMAKKYGINVHGFFMIGIPGESREDMTKTYQFIKENKLNSGTISVMVPYPGTESWNYAESKGIVSPQMDWDYFDMDFVKNNREYLVINDSISRKELLKMYVKIKKELEHKQPVYTRYLSHVNMYKKEVKQMLYGNNFEKYVHKHLINV